MTFYLQCTAYKRSVECDDHINGNNISSSLNIYYTVITLFKVNKIDLLLKVNKIEILLKVYNLRLTK